MLTDKGLITRDINGWFVRTREGQQITCKSMDDAIALLADPRKQFVSFPAPDNFAENYYPNDRVQAWKIRESLNRLSLVIVDTTLNKIVYKFAGALPTGGWELVLGMKRWYETYCL